MDQATEKLNTRSILCTLKISTSVLAYNMRDVLGEQKTKKRDKFVNTQIHFVKKNSVYNFIYSFPIAD